jgi:hypothetical protein
MGKPTCSGVIFFRSALTIEAAADRYLASLRNAVTAVEEVLSEEGA